jgi:hypothetical protein
MGNNRRILLILIPHRRQRQRQFGFCGDTAAG